MSGGHYDYICFKIAEVEIRNAHKDPRRAAFQELLTLVGEAMHDIEWVDSSDYGPGDEHAAIDKCLKYLKTSPKMIAKAAMYDKINEIFEKLEDNNK